MTTTASLERHPMDLSALDDKMDLASSTFPQNQNEDLQDLDFEFDQMETKPIEPTNDNMMDDTTDPGDMIEQTGYQEDVEFLEEEDTSQEHGPAAAIDFNMDEYGFNNEEDEEILYEEEADSTVIVNNPEIQDDKYNEQLPEDAEEFVEPDEILDADVVEDHTVQDTHDDQAVFGDLDDDQAEQQEIINQEAVQDDQDQQADNEQTTRDDGDEPTVDPFLTELQEDPDLAYSKAPIEAELELEESFEEVLEDEQKTDAPQADDSAPEAALLAGNETAQQGEADRNEESETAVSAAHDELHSVKLVYLGDEYSLFPPRNEDSSTFFLTDPGLAFEPLEKLLVSCRQILSDAIEHDDELVLDIPTMGLHICEDSKYAQELSLSQIVEVYLALNRNENRGDIEPLHCNLSTRVCLRTQYNWLTEQAQNGATFSAIVAHHIDSPSEDDGAATAAEQEGPDQEQQIVGETTSDSKAQTHASWADDGGHPGEVAHAEAPEQDESDTANESLTTQDASNRGAFGEEVQTMIEDEDAFNAAMVSNQPQPDADDQESSLEEFQEHNVALEAPVALTTEETQILRTAQSQAEDLEPPEEADVSEYFEEALDAEDEGEAGEQAENLQEAAEDRAVLQEAVASEQVENKSLLADEAGRDARADEEEPFDADEFLIDSDDELTVEAEAPQANGKHTSANSVSALLDPLATPFSKTSKRKVNEEDEDFVLEMDTPEPKRRRPS
jgi:Protein of unknown function (DUF2420)